MYAYKNGRLRGILRSLFSDRAQDFKSGSQIEFTGRKYGLRSQVGSRSQDRGSGSQIGRAPAWSGEVQTVPTRNDRQHRGDSTGRSLLYRETPVPGRAPYDWQRTVPIRRETLTIALVAAHKRRHTALQAFSNRMGVLPPTRQRENDTTVSSCVSFSNRIVVDESSILWPVSAIERFEPRSPSRHIYRISL